MSYILILHIFHIILLLTVSIYNIITSISILSSITHIHVTVIKKIESVQYKIDNKTDTVPLINDNIYMVMDINRKMICKLDKKYKNGDILIIKHINDYKIKHKTIIENDQTEINKLQKSSYFSCILAFLSILFIIIIFHTPIQHTINLLKISKT